MSTAVNKEVVRRLIDEFINKGDLAAAEELIAEDHIALPPSPPGTPQGRTGLLATIKTMRAAFPDLEFTIEDEVAEGDKVATYIIWRGTHQGEFLGIPPTGKRVAVSAMAIDYCSAGQCLKTRMLMDTMSLMQQLGVAPATGQAS